MSDDTSEDSLRVMVVDDHPLIRRGLELMLRGEGYVVSEASDGEQAVELAASARPHLVIMDVVMPGISGIEAARQLHAQDPAIHVLMLSFRDDPETVHAALEAGATSYLTKEAASPEALIDAVRQAAEGQAVFIPGSLINVVTQRSTQKSNIEQLTRREREIARLAAQGLSNRDIAQKLFLSSRTVENYLARIYSKLKVRSRTQLTRIAVTHGLDRPSDVGSGY